MTTHSSNNKRQQAPHLLRGRRAEDVACQYLVRQGLTVIERNFSCKLGETDLIMRDKDSLVFVEVRYRTSNRFGSAAETVLAHGKIQRLRHSAQAYLQQHRRLRELYSRFDVIGITGPLESPDIVWIKDAF